MDITELAEITGIERRRIRYVLDHELVPRLHLSFVEDAAGRPRQFYPDVGFIIACAARLLDFGLAHQQIRDFLSGLLELPYSSKSLPDESSPRANESCIAAMLRRQDISATAYFDEKSWVKVAFQLDHLKYETRWYSFLTKEFRPSNFKPLCFLSLDIARIRDQVFRLKSGRAGYSAQ